jgi:hypothetical protein
MVCRASIAACLVALFVTVGMIPAHSEPAGEPTRGVASGAHEAVVWLRYRTASVVNEHDEEIVATRQKLLETLKSPFILASALRQPDIAALETVQNEEEDPMAWLVAALDVTAPEKTDLIRVGLRGERMADLQQIVDAVAQTFVAVMVEREKADVLGRRDQLEKKFKELQTEIRARTEALAAMADPSDAFSTEIRRELLLGEIGSLRAQRTALQLEILSIQADIAVAGTLGEQADPRKVARLCILEKQISRLTADMDTTLQMRSKNQANRETEEATINQYIRVLEQIGLQLESSAFDLTKPPSIERVEAPTTPEKP